MAVCSGNWIDFGPPPITARASTARAAVTSASSARRGAVAGRGLERMVRRRSARVVPGQQLRVCSGEDFLPGEGARQPHMNAAHRHRHLRGDFQESELGTGCETRDRLLYPKLGIRGSGRGDCVHQCERLCDDPESKFPQQRARRSTTASAVR